MLIVIVRWRYNTTAPILIFDILLPVLPSVLTVLKIHLKRGSQNYVLFLGLPISVIQKKKKKKRDEEEELFHSKSNVECSMSILWSASEPDKLL